jgi:hypothetical protein
MRNLRVTRRQILRMYIPCTSLAIALAVTRRARGTETAPTAVLVSEQDPLAVALNYVSDAEALKAKSNLSYQPGATCAGCSWYQGDSSQSSGPCSFFPGKAVTAKGWCRMWAKRT